MYSDFIQTSKLFVFQLKNHFEINLGVVIVAMFGNEMTLKISQNGNSIPQVPNHSDNTQRSNMFICL